MPWRREIDGVSTVYPGHLPRRTEISELPQVKAALEDGLDPNELWTEEDLIIKQPKGGCVLPNYDFGHDTWPHHNTPLHRAVRAGDVESAELLLTSGADVNLYNSFGSTPLYEAVARRGHDMIRLLLAHGADVNKATVERRVEYEDAETHIYGAGDELAIVQALENEDEEAVSLLANAGANLTLPPDPTKPWTVLDLAVILRNRGCVQVLLDHGAKLSADKSTGISTLSRDAQLNKSRELLAAINGPSYIPDKSVYDAFCHVAGMSRDLEAALQHSHIDNGAVGKHQAAAHALLRDFYNALMVETGIKDLRLDRIKHMCLACRSFQAKAGGVFESKSPFPFELHGSREQLNDSAARGCPLCGITADLLDKEEFKMLKKAAGKDALKPDSSRAVSLTLDLCGPDSTDLLEATLSVACGQIHTQDVISLDQDLSLPTVEDKFEPDTDTSSGGAMQVAKSWLDASQGTSHEYCLCNAATRDMVAQDEGPRRLIQVGAENELPRLIDCQEPQLRYCALSYAQEDHESCITTKSTKPQLELGIASESLPKLFQDAIHVTRALGYEYIWIRALCIVQDDDEDRGHEVDRISSIYSRASMTISSLLNDSYDKGLFRPRQKRVTRHVPLNIWSPSSYLKPGWSAVMEPKWKKTVLAAESPLHSHALALQEHLSSAKILWFGNGILHWECLDGYRTEADPARNHEPRDYQARRRLNERIERRRNLYFDILGCASDTSKSQDNTTLFEHWKSIVQDYTSKHQGELAGRLEGVSSFSKVLATASGNGFKLGAWTGDMLLQSLCWMMKGGAKANPETTRASVPTWSWGSTSGEISFELVERGGRGDEEIIPGARVQIADTHLKAKTRLCKKGPFQTSWLEETSYETLLLEHSVGVSKPVFLDVEAEAINNCHTMDVLAFPQGPPYEGYGYPRWPGGRPPHHIKLLLQPVGGEVNVFRRIGIAVAPGLFVTINDEDLEDSGGDGEDPKDEGNRSSDTAQENKDEDGPAPKQRKKTIEEEMTPMLWLFRDEEVLEDTEIVII